VFPVFIIGCLALITFAFPVDNLSPRLATIMTLVLTSMVFKNRATSFLPAVSYLTLIDKYLNVALLILVTVAFENTWAFISTSRNTEHLDALFAWVFSIVWVAGHTIAGMHVYFGFAYEPWEVVEQNVAKLNDENSCYAYGPSGEENLKFL
jgi:hypothetical protein